MIYSNKRCTPVLLYDNAMNDVTIKSLKNNSDFLSFVKWVSQNIEELNSVDGLAELPNVEAGEEAKVRIKTVQALHKMLKPFIDFAEKKEPTDQDIQRAKEKAGL